MAQLSGTDSGTGGDKRGSMKGKNFSNTSRRKGRDAHLRSPYDTPLRDGNRDRLIGLLTERAAKTLMVYLMETNVLLHNWLVSFYKENPIPKLGSWDEVSGDSFLRKLLAMPVSSAKLELGRDPLFDNSADGGVDPRSMAQRIMEIRSQLATEFVQDLKAVAEENSALLRESLLLSFASNSFDEEDFTPTTTSSATPPSSSASSAAPAAAGTTSFSPTALQPPLPYKRAGERGRSGRQAPESSPMFEADRTPGPPPADSSRKKIPLVFASKAPLKNWRFTAMHSFTSTSSSESGTDGSSSSADPVADIRHFQPPPPAAEQPSANLPPVQPLYLRLIDELPEPERVGSDVDLDSLAPNDPASPVAGASFKSSTMSPTPFLKPSSAQASPVTTSSTAPTSSSSGSSSSSTVGAPAPSPQAAESKAQLTPATAPAAAAAAPAAPAAAAAAAAARLSAEATAAATAAEVDKQMQAYLATVHPEIAEIIRGNVQGWQQQFPDIAAVLAQESAAATATASARFALKNLMKEGGGSGGVDRGVFDGGRSAVEGPSGISIKSDVGGGGLVDCDDEEGWLQQQQRGPQEGQ